MRNRVSLREVGRDDGYNIAACAETLRDATGYVRSVDIMSASAISGISKKGGWQQHSSLPLHQRCGTI